MVPNKFSELTEFFNTNGWIYKFELTRSTQIENDMGITGDDAYEVLAAFAKEFKVDISEFRVDEYFEEEGNDYIGEIFRFFTGREKPDKKILTLGALEKAIIAGKLNDEVTHL